MRYYDLTAALPSEAVVWHGDVVPSARVHNTIDEDGYQTMALVLGTHSGTHIDSPAHLIKGGKSLDRYTLDRFFERCYVLDTTAIDAIEVQHLPSLSADVNGILFSGPTSHLSEQAARHLIGCGVRLFGFSSPSCDAVESRTLPVHRLLFENDALIIEGLARVQQLVGRTVQLVALPLLIDNSDGSPARIIAVIDDH